MSYNLDNFKVKKLENFRIPVKEFSKKDFGKPKIDLETNKIKFESKDSEIGEFKGVLVDGFVELSKISVYGEGGDTVERLSIIDGVEEREDL